jgi:glycosyltransferase involved in cell wall biosynthesis
MGKYVSNVLAHFPRDEPTHWILFGHRPDFPLRHPPLEQVTVHRFRLRGSRFDAWQQLGIPYHARRLQVDLLHCTATVVPWWQPVPTVVTIHDVIPWLRRHDPQDQLGARWYQEGLLPHAYRKCAAIITISENSRRDILNLWPELEPKLHVIPHGIDEHYLTAGSCSPSRLEQYGIHLPYFLYLGGDAPRKRLDWALRVLERLDDPRVKLVVCGVPPKAWPDVLARVRPERRSQVILTPFVDEELMPSLYQHAAAVLYPTLYEGFGLPALEAQAVGTPVLFSQVSSLTELVGPGAVVLPPADLDAWVNACNRCVAEHGAQQPASPAARRWAQQFSWRVSAERHRDVYRSVVWKTTGRFRP